MAASVRTITATRGEARLRLDRVLQRQLTDVRGATRTKVQAWIRQGAVFVNGRAAARPSARVSLGDAITVHLASDPLPPSMVADPEPLTGVSVLHEDAYLLAVSKPAGMVVHPTYGHATGTLMNGLLWHARQWPAAERPSLVGRLDKHTSGIVLVARTRAVHAALQRALANSVSHKDYLALVYGRVTPPRGRIALRLHRDDLDRRRVVASTLRGQPSLTSYERLARVSAPDVGLALLRCRLSTGRMHQIRVHLAARGWPIVGDPTYGESRWLGVVDDGLKQALRAFPRQALHAWRLRFPHPITGAPVCIEAPIPTEMQALFSLAAIEVPLHNGGA